MTEKEITIREIEGQGTQLVISGFSAIEVLGWLRFYEKQVWFQMSRDIEKQIKKELADKINDPRNTHTQPSNK